MPARAVKPSIDIDARDYGVVANTGADMGANIMAALAAAYATVSSVDKGARVLLPNGLIKSSIQIACPGKVKMFGANPRNCVLQLTTALASSTAFCTIGDANDTLAFSSGFSGMTLDANNLADYTVESTQAQEQSGLSHVAVKGYKLRGVYFHTGGCENCYLEHVEFNDAGAAGALAAFYVDTTGAIDVHDVTINPQVVPTHGIYAKGAMLAVSGRLHIERVTNGITLDTGGAYKFGLVDGHQTITTLVNILAGFGGAADFDVLVGGTSFAGTLVKDPDRSVTCTQQNTLGYHLSDRGATKARLSVSMNVGQNLILPLTQFSGGVGTKEVNSAGLTSGQIDALLSAFGTPPNGTILSDPTNGLVLIRQAGVWVTLAAGAAPVAPLVRPPQVARSASNAPVALLSGSHNSDLQSGHAWTLSHSSSGSTAATDQIFLGTQSIRITSQGDGVQSYAQVARQTAIDLTGKAIRVWVRLDSASVAHLVNLQITLGSGSSTMQFTNTALPWDHSLSIEHTGIKADEWVPLTITRASLKFLGSTSFDPTAVQDIRVTVTDDNTSNSVKVWVGACDVITQDTKYPNGVVTICLDDNPQNQWDTAKPILDKYQYPATIALITDTVGTSAHLTLAEIQRLQNEFGWEVMPHAYTQADHDTTLGFCGLTQAQRLADWNSQLSYMITNGLLGTQYWALPQGCFNAAVLADERTMFGGARTTAVGPETVPPADPFRVRTISMQAGVAVTPNTTRGTIEWILDQIAAYGGWLCFVFHGVTTGATGVATETSDFQTIIDYIATKGIPVRTFGEVMRG